MAAARPGASDARVPCPVCGALIHPVAGRCKHCKEDLRGFRSPRPAAGVPLPRLAAEPVAPAAGVRADATGTACGRGTITGRLLIRHAPPSTSPRYASGHAGAHAARPILPPRTTASQYIADVPGDERSAWRHWPVVVIVLAGIAIIGAFAVMLWPPAKAAAGQRAIEPPPTPLDHMDTQPLPPPPADPKPAAPVDPWTDQHSQADPKTARRIRSISRTHSLIRSRFRPDDPSGRPADPYADVNLDLMTAALQHFCRARARVFPMAIPCSRARASRRCSSIHRRRRAAPRVGCLAQFDHLSCSTQLDLGAIQNLFATFDDCSEATHC